jgi:hypothetical protein
LLFFGYGCHFGSQVKLFLWKEDDAMAKTMTPSKTMTDGQIAKAVANYRALLEKHAGEFDSNVVQIVLGQSQLADEQFSVFRRLVEARNWPIWKTIKLGTGIKDANSFRQAIESAEMGIGDWANDILGKPEFTLIAKETEVDLVKVTVGDLGLERDARHDKILDRAKDFGLELCPPEVGPQLRLQYKYQPKGNFSLEWINIGMKQIRVSEDGFSAFVVESSGDRLLLTGNYQDSSGAFYFESPWVFVRPRKC